MRFVKVNSLRASSAKKHIISVYSTITPAFGWWLHVDRQLYVTVCTYAIMF